MKKLNLNAIRTDGGTQCRVEINNEVVAHYAELIRSGVALPPVDVFHDGADYWLADGFHRLHAHRHAEKASIEAEVHSGTVRDATLYSYGANKGHGLQPSNADKRKIATAMLQDEEWGKWSDNKIAKECGFSASFVGDMRRAIFSPTKDAPAVRTVERAGKTYQQDTSHIGKSKPEAKAKPAKKKAAAKPAKRAPWQAAPPPPDASEEMSEAKHTITELATENEQLRDRLAVEAMAVSDDEKTQAAETIRELRALVKTQEAEIAALKVSRDTYMRENGQMKSQINYWRKKAKAAGAEA